MRRRTSTLAIPVLASLCLGLFATDTSAHETPNRLRNVAMKTIENVEGGVDLAIEGTANATYQVRVADAGTKLIVDLFNTNMQSVIPAITTKTGVVGGVLTQTFKDGAQETTRLEINLLKTATYRVRQEGNALHILLSPSGTAMVGGPNKSSPEQIADIQFDRLPAQPSSSGKCLGGCDRILVKTSGVPSYQLMDGVNNKLRLVLKNVAMPEALERTLDVTPFKSPIRYVSTFREKGTTNVVIEIDRVGEDKGTLSMVGDSLMWSFETPKISGDGGAARRTMTLEREAAPNVQRIETKYNKLKNDMDVTEGGAAGFTSTLPLQGIGTSGKYTGRSIDLDLKDADIHNILRLLSDVGHVNIVTADDVAGTVTIRMKNVPWDHALDVVLQAKGLGMVRQGNLIRVAPMATLQKERELRLAQQKQDLELAPIETRIIPVSYAQAHELQARAKDFLSPRGSLAVDERTNVLISRDVSGNLNRIEELVRSLDTQTPQVLVEARVVEATSRYLRDVGIQWGGDATFSQATGNPTGVAFPSRVGLAGGATDGTTPSRGLNTTGGNATSPNFAVNLPATAGTGVGGALGLVFGSLNQNFNLNVRLSAAESSGMLRIVSSPRILTLDNREAKISQGTLIPFSQISAQGVQTTFQEAKLQLLVKPHVTADGSVSMHVKINRDEPDFNQTSARGDPTILKREAETDLLVMDGHTAVIGGIFTRNTGRNIDQIPFFGDIPILGALFQRRRASDSRNELVIFLTPRIVNRAEALGR